MIELLKLCGFSQQEIESELPRVEKTFDKLGITGEDIERGKQRLHKYYDIELEGIRKLLRLYVRELVNLVLAREEGKTKIIYGFMIGPISEISAALSTKSEEVYVVRPAEIFQLVLGCIFDKLVPVLEASERKWLKAGAVAHCGNVKAILGLLALDLIPKPDLLVTSGILCETAPKTIELLQELYDIPTACLDTCLDGELRDGYDQKRVTDLFAKSLRRLTERIQEVAGFEITDEMLWDGIDANDRLNDISARLHLLIEVSDPLPLSIVHDHVLRIASTSMSNIAAAIDALNTLYEELQERIRNGVGVVEKGAPRILAFTPTSYADPRPENIMAESGIASVGTFFGLSMNDQIRQPDLKTVIKDPYDLISARGFSLPGSIRQRIPSYEEGCKRLKIDGVLDRYHAGCRNVVADAVIIQKALNEDLGIPVQLLQWEDFDPRVYNEEQFKSRMEAFRAMLVRK